MWKVLYVSNDELVDADSVYDSIDEANQKVEYLKQFRSVSSAWIEYTAGEDGVN